MLFYRLPLFTIRLSALLFIHCTLETDKEQFDLVQGNASGVGTGLVSGMLFEPEGTAPAKGAAVVVRHKNSTASVTASGNPQSELPLHTTLTNSQGIFSFDTIADGLYVIEGSDDKGNMVLYDSILINNPAEPIMLPADTLEPAGAITGNVVLAEDGNYMQVFVLAFGVDRFCQVQRDGRFLFPRFAGGVYKLKILSLDPAYESFDTAGIVVTSGDTTDIGTIELPHRNLQPVPTSVRVEYDTLEMRAAISWNSTPGSLTAGYNIYRKSLKNRAMGSVPIRLNGEKLIKDTVYLDDFGRHYTMESWKGDSIYYLLTMVDTSGNESRHSAIIAVPVIATWELVDSISLEEPPRPNMLSIFPGNNHITCLGDSYIIKPRNSLTLYRFSHTGTLIKSWKLGDKLKGGYTSSPVIKGTSSDAVGLILNSNQWTHAYDKDSVFFFRKFDSVFVYQLSLTGEYTRQLRIQPDSGGAATDKGGAMINGYLYYIVGHDRINKISMETGVHSPFLNLASESTEIVNIIPDFKGGFVVNVEIKVAISTRGYNTNREYLFFDTEGNRIKALSSSNFINRAGPVVVGNIIAADKTTLYFNHYYFQLNSDGSYRCHRMPFTKSKISHPKDKNNIAVRDDGIIVVLHRIDRKHVLCHYRLIHQ